MTEYKRLDEKAWLEFGKNLLTEKGSEKQKEFLQVYRAGKEDFLEYMREHLLSCKDNVINGEHIAPKHKFAEREFIHPPKDTQQVIWNVFKDVPDEMMVYCGFWANTIIGMIDDGRIGPDYLAAELNGVTKTGIYMIDEALKSGDEKIIDDRVRRILRSMCNPAPRGKRIVFNDFYLGKAYWRWHWATRMSKHIKLEFEEILKVLDEKCYAAFAAKMHTSKSYISSQNTLGGLLLFLKQEQQENKKITETKLKKVIDQLSYLSAWKAIEMQKPNLTQIEIQKISESL